MSYADIVWAHLQKYGSITAKGIESLTNTTCSHDVIRKILKKYGYDILDFKDIKKTVKTIENGKEVKQHKTYREWFLRPIEGI